jgi:hypothetical protein
MQGMIRAHCHTKNMSHKKWAAETTVKAVIDVLVRSHLQGIPFEGRTSIINKALNYHIAAPMDRYPTEREIKATLAKLLRGSMIILVDFNIEHMCDRHETPSYKLSPLVKENIHRRWTGSPRYHPQEELEAIEKAKAEKIKAIEAKERAYQREKQRQEATSFRKHASRKHWIYYVQWENDPEFVKIGYSSKPVDRVASFLTGSPKKLRLLRLEQVLSPREELTKHAKFNAYRHIREWFKYEGALKIYIESLSTSPGIELWEQLSPAIQKEIDVDFF